MSITDWFDPHDIKHVVAFDQLLKTNKWPENFIPKNVKYDGFLWKFTIMSKLAKAWTDYLIERNSL